MKTLLSAKTHTLTKRFFGKDQTPTLSGEFGPLSLNNESDKKELRKIAHRILSEIQGFEWRKNIERRQNND